MRPTVAHMSLQPNQLFYRQHCHGVSQWGTKDVVVYGNQRTGEIVDWEGWTYTMWWASIHMHVRTRTCTHSPELSKQSSGTTLSESVPAWSISNSQHTHTVTEKNPLTHTTTTLRPLLAQCQHVKHNDTIKEVEVLHTSVIALWTQTNVTWSLLYIVWQNRLGLSGLSARQCNYHPFSTLYVHYCRQWTSGLMSTWLSFTLKTPANKHQLMRDSHWVLNNNFSNPFNDLLS